MTPDQTPDKSPDLPAASGPEQHDPLRLHAPVWKGFRLPTGNLLLHVPSAHVLEVEGALLEQALGERHDPSLAAELDDLDRRLPRPSVKAITPDIQAVSLNVAQGCNLRCTYCFAGDGDYGSKAMMSVATATAALAELSAGKQRFHVIFFGGEPLLNYALIQEVVAWCEAQSTCRYSFSMTTNGTLLTEDKLAWLRAKNFSLKISYDGHGLQARQRLNPDRRGNSEARVEGKLERFRDQLAALRDVTLRTTVTRENLDLLEEAIVSTLNAQNFKVLVSQHTTPFKALAFTSADVSKLAGVFARVIDRYLAAGDYERLLKLEHLRQSVLLIHRGRTGVLACGAGVNYVTVSAAGGYYLCHRFNEDESERFGGVGTGLRQERLEAVAAFRSKTTPPCSTCWAREWCGGGCMHEHKSATGDLFTVNPLYCQLLTLELEQAMRVYTILLKNAPHLLEA